ncbi:MAG: ABC transporter permease [Vicinamibacterales bacterium]
MTPLRDLAAEATADLFDDYRRLRATRGRGYAALWLAREAASLAATFLIAAITRAARLGALVRRDTSSAFRSLRRRPGTTAGATVMLAAGLAAVAVAAALATTLLFRPISARYGRDVQRIASVDLAGRTTMRFSEIELDHVRRPLAGTARVASVNLQPVVLRAGDADTQTLAEVVSGNYFDVVGVDIAIGRGLLDPDGRPGSPPVAVISNSLWSNRFGRQPSVLGTEIRLNGASFTVVGVATSLGSSTFLGASVEAWITTAHAGAMLNRDWRTNTADRFWTAIVRSGFSDQPAVVAKLSQAAADLARDVPDPWRERRLVTLPGTVMAGSQRSAATSLAIILAGLSGLILAAAAANVGSLLLAGAVAERSRAAVLMAIGAGRATIIRRLLIEGALLGMGGGVAALAVYLWARQQFAEVALLPTLSLRLDLPFDASLVAITIASGLIAGVLLAIGPAVWSTRIDLAQTLRDGSNRIGGTSGISLARRNLVGAQVAISLTLLVGALLFSRSLSSLEALDVGFPREGLIAMDFDVEPSSPPANALPVLAREALARAAALPGVVAAAMSNRAPVDSSTPTVEVRRTGDTSRGLADVTFYLATQAYFDTVGVPVVQGRAFSADEADREADVAIINQTLSAQLWPEGDPLGRSFSLQPPGRTVRVVGVARNSKYRSLSEPARPHFYLPTSPRFGEALLVRTSGQSRNTIVDLQRALGQVGPGVVGFFPRTFDDHLAIDVLPTKAAARAAMGLGALALVLSTVGLYGMVMWFVEMRRREIGVRLALGAPAHDVRRLVVRQALLAAAPGALVGVIVATGLATIGRSTLVGVGPVDPWSLGLGLMTLAIVVAAASYLPSRRATKVDPLAALRES